VLDHDVPRRLEEVVRRRVGEEPVVALHGARTVGKSTLLGRVAGVLGRSRIDLDDPATRAAAAADPALFVSGAAPVLIDEYQHVPTLLDAIKAELNRDLRPGRFVLTGSTTYGSLPLSAQSLTGRLHRVDVWPLSQGEIAGQHETFLEALFADPASLATAATSPTLRPEYIARIVRGGLPLAVRRPSDAARNRWFDDYVALVVERDVLDLARIRQREALPRLLAQFAAQTGGVLSIASAARRARLEPSTAENYTKLLEAAFLLHRLPAWGRTLRSRVTATPKLHLVDSGLAARLLRLSPDRLERRDAAALSELGHLVETFAVNELLKQATWAVAPISAGHFRTKDGVEVDLVLERDDGALVGVEIKAASAARPADAVGLRVLRELAGDAFLGGVVLYLGERAYQLDDKIWAVPLDRLWIA
jgi:predicted AAA+ superfamily ATPase